MGRIEVSHRQPSYLTDEKPWEPLKEVCAVPGASIDLEKTSNDYEDTNTAYFWNRLSFWNYARPPSVILEVGLEPGFLEMVPMSQGQ